MLPILESKKKHGHGILFDLSEFANSSLRVALFTDSFYEVNGVATLSQNFVRFAQAEHLPILCVHGGRQTRITQEGSCCIIELKRSSLAFRLDADLYCDPLLNRYRNFLLRQLSAFKPDLIHITGPGDVGILGLWVAHLLRIPLAASWHTNLHEYVYLRLNKTFRRLPERARERLTRMVERQTLRALMRFYKMPRFLLAPNRSTVDLLQQRTGRQAFPMRHGVDLERFAPADCDRRPGPFRIGYVGRFTPEKNVRYLAELEHNLILAGENRFRFLLVGEGSEQNWLRQNLQFVDFAGVLRGRELAGAFAAMDVFVFPSRTDTFGLVLLEAMASGVPAVLSPEAGTRLGIQHGVNGMMAEDFTESVLGLMRNETFRCAVGSAARDFAASHSWCDVFKDLYLTYQEGLKVVDLRRSVAEARRAARWRWLTG